MPIRNINIHAVIVMLSIQDITKKLFDFANYCLNNFTNIVNIHKIIR
jgi:hypothetical protein